MVICCATTSVRTMRNACNVCNLCASGTNAEGNNCHFDCTHAAASLHTSIGSGKAAVLLLLLRYVTLCNQELLCCCRLAP